MLQISPIFLAPLTNVSWAVRLGTWMIPEQEVCLSVESYVMPLSIVNVLWIFAVFVQRGERKNGGCFVGKVNSGLNVMHITIIASHRLEVERSHQNILTSYWCINNMYGIQLFFLPNLKNVHVCHHVPAVRNHNDAIIGTIPTLFWDPSQ